MLISSVEFGALWNITTRNCRSIWTLPITRRRWRRGRWLCSGRRVAQPAAGYHPAPPMSGYMNPAEFANIFKGERNFWWYRGVRPILLRVMEPYLADRKIAWALEAGCGTGYLAEAGCKKIADGPSCPWT